MKAVSETRSFGGVQRSFEHPSSSCRCTMRLSVFTPPKAGAKPLPTLIYLSGLTCTDENVTVKSGFQRIAAELGLIVVAPDTSPRGEDVPDAADEYDFGQGAGFYLDAKAEPWSEHFQMESYVAKELPELLAAHLPVDAHRIGVFGHSMGGHGALTLHLKHPRLFKTVSAFSPIVAPMRVPWGEKALSRYLGKDRSAWVRYDATELAKTSPSAAEILVDQGDADQFLDEQLRPDLLREACAASGQALTLRRHPGYDHSYFFISTFMEDHLRWHAKRLD